MKRTEIRLQRKLARIARTCATKKEMATHVKGAALDEAWRIHRIQKERWNTRETARVDGCLYGSRGGSGFQSYYLTPQKLSKWQARQIKPRARKHVRRWPFAGHYGERFRGRLSARITRDWTYACYGKTHSLGLRHKTKAAVSVECSRSASSYTVMSVTLSYDLLRQEAVWIGGLLTIRLKEDAAKQEYPCSWLELNPGTPGLNAKHGKITGGNYHVELDAKGEPRRRRINRPAEGVKQTPRPPRGWATRECSLRAGNCPSGTDHFIKTKLIPALKASGYTIGNLNGAAFHIEFVRELQDDMFTRRLSA